MSTTRNIGREIGTAFAVLAIYLLTLLAPLHQARAGQLAFERLGYSALEASWALCTPAGLAGSDRDDVPVSKCPVTGSGKADLVVPVPDALPIRHEIARAAPMMAPAPALPQRPAAPPGGPRAPPALV